jgi:hypothetical protein
MKIVSKSGCAIGAVVSLVLAGAAHAQTVKTGVYTIDAMAMGPEKVNSSTNYAAPSGGGLRNAAAESTCFNAATQLPHGATVTRVTVWYSSTASDGTYAAVRRYRLSDGQVVFVADKELVSTGGQRKAINVPLSSDQALSAASDGRQKIDNARHSYAFTICLLGLNKASFHGARITYTYVD